MATPVQPVLLEKHDLAQIEAATLPHQQEGIDEEFSPAEQKKIIRRLDRRLVVTCGVMFCFSLMDRTNLGAASIAGMTKDLKLIQYRYVSAYCHLEVSEGLFAHDDGTVNHCPRIFHHLCLGPTGRQRGMQKDWTSPVPCLHNRHMGDHNRKLHGPAH